MSAESDTLPLVPRSRLLRNALLFVSTAAFGGGLAVVFWNRKELAHIQYARSKATLAETASEQTEDEEII